VENDDEKPEKQNRAAFKGALLVVSEKEWNYDRRLTKKATGRCVLGSLGRWLLIMAPSFRREDWLSLPQFPSAAMKMPGNGMAGQEDSSQGGERSAGKDGVDTYACCS